MANVQVIQRLIVPSARVYEVGSKCPAGVVIEIKCNSQEYEDHVHVQYDVYGEDYQLLATVINCPVIVEYVHIAE
jgi:hypothetical protein